MTSINQLLIDRDSQNFLINYNKNGKESVFQKQGKKYNKLQKKNAQSVKNNILREGYEGLYDFGALENKTKTATQSQSILAANGLSSSDKDRLLSLQSQYEKLMQDIDVLEKSIMTTTQNYTNVVSKNSMANQNIMFSPNKESAYITNAGYAKVFKSQDDLTKTGGNNNCPSSQKIKSINTSISGVQPGNLINSDPALLMGTPMVPGQSCGYEGENVYVSSILPSNTAPTFVGCYGGGNTGKPLMKVLGASPGTSTSNIVKNGDFSQPALASGSYKLFNDGTSMPGWRCFGGGISNGSTNFGFPTPYAGSGQALIIMGTSFVSQIVTLNPGIFSLSFLTAGSKTAGANKISIMLSQLITPESGSNVNDNIITFTPSVTGWQQYPSGSVTTDFTIKNPGNYVLIVQGNSSNAQQVTAIQNLAIVDKSSGTVNQNYSFQDCEQAAIYGGYQYFSLNNVNPTTGYGFCSVSNVGSVNTNIYPENPLVIQSIVPLWSSNTANVKTVLAVLTESGQLQMMDGTGTSKASFGGGPKNSTGYIGCYNDKGFPDTLRSMSNALNGKGEVIDVTKIGGYSRQWDYNSCESAAQTNDFKYFGLQWNNGNNPRAQCFLSNDLGTSTKYGKSSNCWKVGGNMVGGGWTNAIHSVDAPVNSPYFLIVQDDGNICVYKGTGPGDSQGMIWQTGTNGKAKDPDPTHTAALGKNGRSYLKIGEMLHMGEFIGNTNGTVYLIMQTDGNLVAYTSVAVSSCSKSEANKNNIVASGGDYAIHKISASGIPGSLGKMAYIDNNGTLMEYPSTMLSSNSKSFTTIPNTDSTGNDIGSPVKNASVEKVQVFAAETPNCIGFVYDKNTQTGYLKNKMANVGSLIVNHARDIYIMRPSIAVLPDGVNPTINEIDSVLYQNYPKGPSMSPDYKNNLVKMTSVQEAQLGQLYDSLNLIASQLNAFTAQLKERGINVSNQIAQNNSFINEGAMKLEQLNAKIKKNSMRDLEVYNQILNDNELLATSQNYSYMIWTIIALGVVIVTVNASR